VRDVAWAPGTLVVTVDRDGSLLLAEGGTDLRAGDILSAICPRSQARRFRELVGAEVPGSMPPGGPDMV
jgi:Trk K+ transport system NAD-binding subunit